MTLKRFQFLAPIFLLLMWMPTSGFSQTQPTTVLPNIYRTFNLTAASPIGPAATPWISERGTGVKSHTIVWTTSGTVSTCSVKVESSPDGVTWSDLIAGATCTSSSSAANLTTGIANYVRVNATTLTGSGTLIVSYFGFVPGTGSAVSSFESDGANVTLGTTTDAANTATNGTSVTAISLLKELSVQLQALGAAITPINSACAIVSAASTNATSCKASAGNRTGLWMVNTTATLYYLRLYNTASAPTCSSATGFIQSIPIPASATGAGVVIIYPIGGVAFATGFGYCLTGGSSSTDNSNAATGLFGEAFYN